ncbi:N-formylglutamate amidohydrolase [Thioalkalivibrio sp. K90mix]|uniref:N-formylglutamate amidohydrolase n=1 Tax=unclassified Thioalkalivibrio TaxID=2621013 RepID=UPI000195A704|nr:MULTISPECIES: N-formylglutamate amidohydrolase [unclassified Thioalkalivibrio]ADC71550.1 N-formylglutamate amidohydrolase [Thioalkalivibrio sp. K90mix]
MQVKGVVGRAHNELPDGPPDAGLVITCEHGGNRIPAPYRDLLRPYRAILQSHRGFDAGSLQMARDLARAFGAPLAAATVTRLLVDLNRSLGHPQLHCAAVRKLPASVRARIVERHYQPYRSQVELLVREGIARDGQVVHVSSHSFTPELDGKVRTADIGLLYDPARPGEVALAARWKAAIKACAPELTVRRNYPYAGRNDGLTTSLRKGLSPECYAGVELEINQRHVLRGGRHWAALRETVIASLRTAFAPRGTGSLETANEGGQRRDLDAPQLPAVPRDERHAKGVLQ